MQDIVIFAGGGTLGCFGIIMAGCPYELAFYIAGAVVAIMGTIQFLIKLTS